MAWCDLTWAAPPKLLIPDPAVLILATCFLPTLLYWLLVAVVLLLQLLLSPPQELTNKKVIKLLHN